MALRVFTLTNARMVAAVLLFAAGLEAVSSSAADPSGASVKLSGIFVLSGKKQACLMVRDSAPAGQPAAASRSCVLREGQKDGAVEVLEIDEKAGRVRVRNGSKEMELTFESDGIRPSAAPVPAVPPPAVHMAAAPSAPSGDALIMPPGESPAFEQIPAANRVFVFGRSTRRANMPMAGILTNFQAGVPPGGGYGMWRPSQPASQPAPLPATTFDPVQISSSPAPSQTPVLLTAPVPPSPPALPGWKAPDAPPPSTPSYPGTISSAGFQSAGARDPGMANAWVIDPSVADSIKARAPHQ